MAMIMRSVSEPHEIRQTNGCFSPALTGPAIWLAATRTRKVKKTETL
jgi:hypothetical protein